MGDRFGDAVMMNAIMCKQIHKSMISLCYNIEMAQEKAQDTVKNVKSGRGFWARNKAVFTLLAVGFVAGFLWLAALRFFLVKSPETHYHANFAVYINGEREMFEEFTYYEEVAACTSDYSDNPKGRTHMHDQVNDVIHVHDKRVTYGNFFQNIGWNIGSNYIATIDKLYQNNGKNKVTYILNGERERDITNRIIGNMDRLLVVYGDASDEQLQEWFDGVADTAKEVNSYQDPASCSGLNGAGYDSLGNRLKRATFWQ